MKVIDLSQTFENNMSQFPGTPKIQLEAVTSVEKSGYQITDFHSVVHVGTHCDALRISFQAQRPSINYR